jgi:hypothetical protein
MVIDHNDHPTWLRRLFSAQFRACIAKKFSQARNIFDTKVMRMRVLEEGSLGTDGENELITSMGLDFAEPPDEVHGIGPTQIPGQFSHEKAGVKQVEIVAYMCTHSSSMSSAKRQSCIDLLTKRFRLGHV